MMPRSRSLLLLACLLAPAPAAAQPKQPAPKPAGDKGDAKALMASGVRLLEAKDYLGALAVFKDAYARFPSARILLNIGTSLRLLKRHADAANAYQRYLEAPDADPAKKAEVEKAITELDALVGRLELSVTPPDAEVQINDEEWRPTAAVTRYRVEPGAFTVRARKEKFQATSSVAQVAAGERKPVAIALTALPEPAAPAPAGSGPAPALGDDPALHAAAPPPEPRSRLGALAMVRVDAPRRGAAALIGLTVDALPRLQLQGAALLGPFYGGYAGAGFSILDGAWRPFAAAGMTIFASDGARYSLRAAGGLELLLSRHVSLIAELGVEYVLNEQLTDTLAIKKTVFIPAVGAAGRL
jgi:tetratricopeptide (TPR) repeat protein